MQTPDREPDFSFSCNDWEGEKERTLKYWVKEKIREITFHQRFNEPKEVNQNIDAQYMYENTKDFVDAIGDNVDPEYKTFVDLYEHYLVEQELLGESEENGMLPPRETR